MIRKLFGLIALGAVIATTATLSVKANQMPDVIWVYANGDKTDSPFCPIQSDELCAQLHEYDAANDVIGNPIDEPGSKVYGERP